MFLLAPRLRLSLPYPVIGVPTATVTRGSSFNFSIAALNTRCSRGVVNNSFAANHAAPAAIPSPIKPTTPYDAPSTALTGFSGIHLSVTSS
jgi:hypothetical protein